MQAIHKNPSKSKNHPNKPTKPTTKTKTRLANNGKVMVEGAYLDLDNDIDGSDDELALPERIKINENGQLHFGQYSYQNAQLSIYNVHFDWGKIFRKQVEDREKVEELNLLGCEPNEQNISELASLDWWNVKSLTISQYYYFQKWRRHTMAIHEVDRLLENEWPALEKLSLFDIDIGNSGIQAIMETASLPKLKQLDVGRNQITVHGLSLFLDAKFTKFVGLTLLSLEFNLIGSTGVKLLVKAELPNLEILKLAQCGFGDEGARHLIKGHWPNLQQIRINDNHLELTGYQAITLNHWPQLKKFEQTYTECSCCGYHPYPGIDSDWKSSKISALSLIICPQPSVHILDRQVNLTQAYKEFLPIYHHRNVQ